MATIRASFKKSRIQYKKAAVLLEYYYPNERRYINGPDLERVEEDNPGKILMPHGFQVMEKMIFSDFNTAPYPLLEDELTRLQGILEAIQRQPNLSYKFKKETVIDAVKAALIKLVAKGITGFDSPIALYSIPEASATLTGIQNILSAYESLPKISALINAAINNLQSNNHFATFDRLGFIARYTNPLYEQVVELAQDRRALLPQERRPLNQYARSIFGKDLFDINFFSPNERYRVTENRINLGAALFYDTILSGGNKRSCASCHRPEQAFTDGLPKALSVDGKSTVDRNTPTLWNAALQTQYFYDSRVSTLENQLSIVVHSAKEMNGSIEESILELRKDEKYAAFFRKAYAGDKEPVTAYTIANAVSSYVRSLVAFNSRFDQYIGNQKTRLSAAERSGFNLFAGKAKCATCHYLPLFNGLIPPEFTETESEVLGTPASLNTLPAMIDPDMGKYLFTNAMPHQHSFKTPTLRNIALTAPYMHNGVYQTLEEVLDFYNKGGGSGLQIAIKNQTLPTEKLGLTKKETQDIIAFLQTLTDTTYKTPGFAK